MSRAPYEYTVLRVVPSIEREEFINVGVLLFCKVRRFLGCRSALDPGRLALLDPAADLAGLQEQLDLIQHIAAGDPAGGALAALPAGERFRWLASPRNTMVTASPVHAGLCDDPAAALAALFARLVPAGWSGEDGGS